MYELKPTITKYQQVKQIPMRECLKRNTHTHNPGNYYYLLVFTLITAYYLQY